METGVWMPHSQGLSNNPYPEPNHKFFVLIPIYLSSILILSSHLRLSLPKGLFLVCVPVTILKALLPSSILTTWPAHLNVLHLITLTKLGERYKLWSSSLWSLHSPSASLLSPNIRLRILFSNTRPLIIGNEFSGYLKYSTNYKDVEFMGTGTLWTFWNVTAYFISGGERKEHAGGCWDALNTK